MYFLGFGPSVVALYITLVCMQFLLRGHASFLWQLHVFVLFESVLLVFIIFLLCICIICLMLGVQLYDILSVFLFKIGWSLFPAGNYFRTSSKNIFPTLVFRFWL